MNLSTFEIWRNHFEYHAQHARSVPAELPDTLTGDEHSLIAGSISIFQLGAQSSGRTLLRAAAAFAERQRWPALPRIMELCVAEEQRHATLLLAFMMDHGIAPRRGHWTDGVFRGLRRLAGFELYLHVLIVAELIGNVYYRALEVATGCQRLKVLCRTLVADELAHVAFESQLLMHLQGARSEPLRLLGRAAHRTCFAAAALVVWVTHRRVLSEVGFGACSFLSACRAQFDFYLGVAAVPEGRRTDTRAER